MEEIKKAILGSKGAYANGQRQFAGYAADMGSSASLIDGTDGQPYRCIRSHIAVVNNCPITGGNWRNFWMLDITVPLPGVNWEVNTIYAFPPGTLTLDSSVTGTDGQIYRCTTLHVADNANHPITGANWENFWVQDSSMSGGNWYANAVFAAPCELLWLSLPGSVDGVGVGIGHQYRCIKFHVAGLDPAGDQPEVAGSNWNLYWVRDDTIPGGTWAAGEIYEPPWVYQGDDDSRIWCGWRGPYIETPPTGMLKDGWGNPFYLTIVAGDIIIMSHGANGVINPADTGFDEDITLRIRHIEYMAPVAGRIKMDGLSDPDKVKVKIYFSLNGTEDDRLITRVDNNSDYFRFEEGASGDGKSNIDIPVGLRSITAWEDNGVGVGGVIDDNILNGDEKRKYIVFCVEPTGNWLGMLELTSP